MLIDQFISLNSPVIDVRSEGEFKQGYFPEAVNIPLLNDEERAKVGTCYKQKGRVEAVLLGYELAGRKFHKYAHNAVKIARKNELRIYCWRGGMRSGIMSQIFRNVGINVTLLKGGYKSYRIWVLQQLSKNFNFTVVGGKTGTGKTELLKYIESHEEQVINLEQLANHKGSAYGGIGLGEQPSNEHFENELAWKLSLCDCNKPIWVENESRNIGKIKIPDGIFEQMRNATVLEIEVPVDIRIKRILNEYARLPKDELINATKKLEKRLGNMRMKMAIAFLNDADFENWAALMLEYYDKTYTFSNNKRSKSKIINIELPSDDYSENASMLINYHHCTEIKV